LGLFVYADMAQGLKGACAFFQKMVNEVYVGLRFTGENELENVFAVMAAYLNDLAVKSDSVADHLVDLEAVLERTRGAGLKLAKSLFEKRSEEHIGHRVFHGLVRSSDDHTAVFATFKEPRNASELLRFIGLVTFFGEHVESAAARLAPLNEFLVGTDWNRKKRKKQKVLVSVWAERWKELQVRAFEALRKILAHPDFLVAPHPLATKKLVTDASMYGLRAMLLQWEGDDAGWLPVAFASRK
jgi:RNase H-like domain found in reverse transcriptase